MTIAENSISNLSKVIPHEHKEHTPWWEYFTFSTDHKVIGIQYLVTTFAFYLLGEHWHP